MPTKTGPDRIPCEVPGCGRTAHRKPEYGSDIQIICGPHWRMAPRYMKDRYAKIRRAVRKARTDDDLRRASSMAAAYWDNVRRRVIEIAMGISA